MKKSVNVVRKNKEHIVNEVKKILLSFSFNVLLLRHNSQ